MRSDLTSRYEGVREVLVVHNASVIDATIRYERQSTNPQRLRLGLLSNLSREKGLDVALATLRATRAAGVDTSLTLAGPLADQGDFAMIEEAKAEFAEDLKTTGQLSGAAKQKFFSEIDIFLFPSRYRFEAQPLVVLEALAAGCIPVVSHAGYNVELVGPDLPSQHSLADYPGTVLTLCKALLKEPNLAVALSRTACDRYQFLRDEASRQVDRLSATLAGEE